MEQASYKTNRFDQSSGLNYQNNQIRKSRGVPMWDLVHIRIQKPLNIMFQLFWKQHEHMTMKEMLMCVFLFFSFCSLFFLFFLFLQKWCYYYHASSINLPSLIRKSSNIHFHVLRSNINSFFFFFLFLISFCYDSSIKIQALNHEPT